MRKLQVGDTLYHASYVEIRNIDLSKCSDGKDFGHGFYVTSSVEQAKAFVPSSVRRAIAKKMIAADTAYGYINVYRVDIVEHLTEYDFTDADKAWLHYVAGNRDSSFFTDEVESLAKYNVIGGKIANDQTSAALNQYIGFSFGEPGSADADDFCIKKLLPNRLKDQYCFKDEAAITSLKFIDVIRVEI